MASTVDQFGKALVAAGLMTAEDVKALWAEIPAAERPRDGEAFARRLVEAKRLTEFQARQLLAGRGASLQMGDYTILAEIGAGGMGQVYKARHRRMDRVVALKVMSSAAMKDEAAVKRFQREVRAAAKLEHSNIVTAYDSGEAGNVKYLVMQFVDGGDLSSLIKTRGPLPVQKAANYVLQAARGLAFAHGEGVIHRDIKPANLLLDKKGVVKILDMGLARFDSGDDGLTATEQVMGTVDYMSPEQAANTKGVDARADIYSLGCTLWYLLTGKKLYDGDSMIARLMAHREAPLPSLVKERDDAPWALEQALHKMIAKRPQDRYQSMDEVVAALEPHGEGSSGAMGSSIGGGGTQNAELAAFFQGIGPKSTTTSKTGTAGANDATAAFTKASVGTDPKSALLPPGEGGRRPDEGRAASLKAHNKSPKLLVAALSGVAAIVVLGVGLVFALRDGESDEVATGTLVSAAPSTAPVTSPQPHTPAAVVSSPTPIAQPAPAVASLPSSAEGDREAIFNGRDLTGWRPLGGAQWSAGKDDVLVGQTKSTPGWLMTEREFDDFELTLDYKLGPEGNSGVFLRCWPEGVMNGGNFHEVQLLDDAAPRYAGVRPDQRTGGLYGSLPPQTPVKLATDAWHKLRLTVVGDRLTVRIDDLPVLDGTLPPGKRSRGNIGLQAHSGRSDFRNIRVRELNPDGTPRTAVTASTEFALEFDETTNGLFLHDLKYDGSHPLTIEAWAKPAPIEPPGNARRHLVFHPLLGMKFDYAQRAWQLGTQTEKTKYFSSQAAANPAASQFVHVAGTYADGRLSLFLNGKLQFTQPLDAPLLKGSGSNQFYFADGPENGANRFFGVLDEVRISNVVRYTSDFTPQARFEPDDATLALYHFDEGKGDQTNDATANRRHLPLEVRAWGGRPKWVDASARLAAARAATAADLPRTDRKAERDFALEFDGAATRVELPLNHSTATPFTLEATIVSSVTSAAIVSNTEASGIALDVVKNAAMFAVGRSSAGVNQYVHADAPRPLQAGTPHRIAGSFDGKLLRLFVDGKLAATAPFEGSYAASPFPLAIGASPEEGGKFDFFFKGVIDEVRISKSARYTSDYMPTPRLVPDADTLALYHFDEGAGDVLKDSSGNGRDGKIVGAKWVAGLASEEQTSTASKSALDFSPKLPVGAAHVVTGKAIDLRRPFTLEAFITPRSNADEGQSRPIVNTSGGMELKLYGKRLSWMASGVRPGDPTKQLIVNSVAVDGIETGKRFHVAGVSNGQELRFYVEGKLIGRTPLTVELPTNLRPIVLGGGSWAGFVAGGPGYAPFDGTIDEFRLSESARYDAPFAAPAKLTDDDATAVLYRFGEGAGTVLHDLSGYGNEGQIVGAKWTTIGGAATAAPAAKHFASDEWVDVIPLIDPAQDKFAVPGRTGANDWRIENGELKIRTDDKPAKLLFPVVFLGPALEIEVEFTRVAGDKGFNLDVPAKAGPCPVIFDSSRPGRALVGDPAVELDGACRIETGKRTKATMKITARSGLDHVELFWNGRSLGHWAGNREFISVPKQEGYRHDQRTGLWITPRQELIFHSVRARALQGGKIERLRGDANAPQAAAAPIDLLAGVLIPRDIRSGNWRLENGTLFTPPQENGVNTAVLYLPTPGPVPAEYDVELVVERVEAGGTGMVFGFVSGGRQATVMMDSYGNPNRWGIDEIDGQYIRDPSKPTYNAGRRLTQGERKAVKIEVRKTDVRVAVDAEQVVDWKGRPEQLGTAFWKVDRKDSLFFGSQARFIVHSAKLTPR